MAAIASSTIFLPASSSLRGVSKPPGERRGVFDRRRVSFGDTYFLHTCAADARLGAAGSTQLMSLRPGTRPLLRAFHANSPRTSLPPRGGRRTSRDSSLEPAANDPPGAAWSIFFCGHTREIEEGPATIRPSPLFMFSPWLTALWHLREIVLRNRTGIQWKVLLQFVRYRLRTVQRCALVREGLATQPVLHFD